MKSKNIASPASGMPRIATPPTIVSRSDVAIAGWAGAPVCTCSFDGGVMMFSATGAVVGMAVIVGDAVATGAAGASDSAGGADGAGEVTIAGADSGSAAGGPVVAGSANAGRTMTVSAVETAPPALAAASR